MMLINPIGSGFLVDPKAEFNGHIDAPVETEEELSRASIPEKIHQHRDGQA
jgi:hypothetical protein